jgi:hypothetical protein
MTTTRLWLLTPHAGILRGDVNPWRPWYDKVFAAVVRADSEDQARELVQAQAGHEGLDIYGALGMEEEEAAPMVWLDNRFTSCIELQAHGAPGIVIIDRRRA